MRSARRDRKASCASPPRIAIDVEGRLPIRMAREHGGMLRGVAQDHERLIAGVDREHGVAGGVAGGRDRDDAGRDFRAGRETRDVPRDIRKMRRWLRKVSLRSRAPRSSWRRPSKSPIPAPAP